METPTKVLFTSTPAMSVCNSSPAGSDATSTISSSLLSRHHHSASSQRHGSVSMPMIHLSNADTQIANSPGTTTALQAHWSTISAAMKGHSQAAAELLMKQAGNTAQLEEMVKALFSQLKAKDDEKAALQAQLKRDRAEFTSQAKVLSQHFTASQHKSTALQVIHEALQAELKSTKESLSDSVHVNNTLRQQLEQARQEAQERSTSISNLQSQLDATQSVLKDVEQQNDEHMSMNKDLRASNTALKSQLASLVAAERELTEQLRSTHKQIDEQLGLLRQQLKNERQRRLLVTRRKSDLAVQVARLTEQVATLSAQPNGKGHGQGSNTADTHIGRNQVLPPMRKVLQSRAVLVRSSASAASGLKRPVRLITQRGSAARSLGTAVGVASTQLANNNNSANPTNASGSVHKQHDNNVHDARILYSPVSHVGSAASSQTDVCTSSVERPSRAASMSEPGQLRQQRRTSSQSASTSGTPVSRMAAPAAAPRSASQHSLRGTRPVANNGNIPVSRTGGSNPSTPHVSSGGVQRTSMQHPCRLPTTPITTSNTNPGDALHLLTPTSQHVAMQVNGQQNIASEGFMHHPIQTPQLASLQSSTTEHIHKNTPAGVHTSQSSAAPSYVLGLHPDMQPLNLESRLEVLPLSREISEETVGATVPQPPSMQGFRIDSIQIVHENDPVSHMLRDAAPLPTMAAEANPTSVPVSCAAVDNRSNPATDDRLSTSTLQPSPPYHLQQLSHPAAVQTMYSHVEQGTEPHHDHASVDTTTVETTTNSQQGGLQHGPVPLASLQQVQQLLQGLRLLQQQVGPPSTAAAPPQQLQSSSSNQRIQAPLYGVQQIPATLTQSFVKPGNYVSPEVDRAHADQHANKQQTEQHAAWLHQMSHNRSDGGHDGGDRHPMLKSVALLQAYHAQQQQQQSRD